MEPIVFNRLENAQNVSKIARIFSDGKPNYVMKPNPLMVILVGSPGVGKTTKAKEFLKQILQVDYDNFYNISLDSIVERVKPYRTTTKALYNTLKAKRGNSNLTNENFATLSEAYLPTIMAKTSNFKLPQTQNRITRKIQNLEPVAPPRGPAGALTSLLDMRKEGLKYGVANGLNILYDTTFRPGTNIIKRDIMPILETNKEVKYKIVVILVKADAAVVKNRIARRHKAMLEENDPYLRAVAPTLVSEFIRQNKVGFDETRDYFESAAYQRNTADTVYNKKDFSFIEIDNPVKGLNNNNGSRNFRYF
jgi:dephospho-CoA kinase